MVDAPHRLRYSLAGVPAWFVGLVVDRGAEYEWVTVRPGHLVYYQRGFDRFGKIRLYPKSGKLLVYPRSLNLVPVLRGLKGTVGRLADLIERLSAELGGPRNE
jgi:hypothetical protein